MKIRSRSGATLCAVIASVSLFAIGCNEEDAPTPSAPQRPPDLGMSSRWIPNPSVDLMSSEGTFIRAFVESRKAATQSAEHTGLKAFDVDGFPGFTRAFNNVEPPERVGGLYPDFGRWGAGTWYYEVVEMQPHGSGFTAVVCGLISMVADRPEGGADYRSGGSKAFGQGFRLAFSPDPRLPTEQQQSPAADQRGPADRPPDDVFGTWVALDFKPLGYEPTECVRLAPGTPTNWPSPYYRKDPPPTLSPEPGWPAGSPA